MKARPARFNFFQQHKPGSPAEKSAGEPDWTYSMKRLFSLLLSLSVLLTLSTAIPPQQAFSRAETWVRVVPLQGKLLPGETTTVAVRVESVETLRAFDVSINFDPELLYIDPSSLLDGGFLGSGLFPPENGVNNDAGTITFGKAISGNAVSSGDGILFTFALTAGQTPGQAALTVTQSHLVDFAHFPVDHGVEDGLVRINLIQTGHQLYLPLILR